MNSYVTENQFFAPISFYKQSIAAGGIMLEANENYQKRSFRNKCIIACSQGVTTLKIPLAKGKHQQMPIKEVKFSFDEDWRDNHLKTIKSNYGSSPYYEHVYEQLEDIYAKKHKYLYAFNLSIHQWVLSFLDLDLEIKETLRYLPNYEEDTIDARSKLKPNNYKEQISTLQQYPQVFENKFGFIPNLSILDLLFCCGRESILFLS